MTDDQAKELIRYLDEIVDPTINDFAQSPASVRHAFLACVVTFHTIDYLASARTMAKGNLLKVLRKECPKFKVVEDIANRFKHVATGPHTDRMKASQVKSKPAPHHEDKTFFGGADPNEPALNLDRPRGRVTLDDNSEIDVLDTVMRAAKFLRTKVPEKG